MPQNNVSSADEQAPLLAPRSISPTSPRKPESQEHFLRRRLVTIALCITLIFTLEIGAALVNTALMQVQENILCDHLNPSTSENGAGESPEDHTQRCSDNKVQNELSIIQSWNFVFELLPGLIMAVPFGLIADRYGRVIVLGLSMTGMALAYFYISFICYFPDIFPLRLIWLACLFNFIGGGLTVFSAMVFAIATDISSESERSTLFSYLAASMMLGAIVAGPITYWVIQHGLWLSIFSGLFIIFLCNILTFCIPESLRREPEVADDAAVHSTGLQWEHVVAHAKSGAKRFGNFIHHLVREEKQVGVLLLSLLFTTFGRNSQIILMQYIRRRYEWSFHKVGLVVSVQSACSAALFLVVLPFLTHSLSSILPPRAKDLYLARGSSILLATGSLAIGLAPTPPLAIAGVAIAAFGFGYNILVRSLMTSLMPRDIAVLYTAFAWLETVGTIIVNPLLAASFRTGIRIGGGWIGLPYYAAAALFSCAVVIVASTSVKEDGSGDQEDGGEVQA